MSRAMRVLGLGRGRIVSVELVEDDGVEQVLVEVALRSGRAMRCSSCGERARAAYDTRQVTWRHLDVGLVALPDPL